MYDSVAMFYTVSRDTSILESPHTLPAVPNENM